jgi:general secretion pathway protein F
MYKYIGTRKGEVHEGVIAGTDELEVKRKLQQQGILPVSILPCRNKEKSSFSFTFSQQNGKLNQTDIAFVTKQLALLVGGGKSLDGALRSLRKQAKKPAVQEFTLRLENRIKEGASLSEALKAEPLFSSMYVNIVKAGEESGALPEMLMNIVESQQAAHELRQFVISSAIYPLFLAVAGFGIIMALLFGIMPRFETLFAGLSQDLPLNIMVLMAISTFLTSHPLVSLFLCVGPFAAGYFLFRKPAVKRYLADLTLRLPVISSLVRNLETTRIFHTLEVLVKNGVHLVTALKIASGVVAHRQYRDLLIQAAAALKEGQAVAPKLQGGLIDDLAVDLLAMGEESGQIGRVCGQIASHFEGELRSSVKNLIAVIEPAFILVMAAGVGTIVLSMLSVILSMNDIMQ